MACTQTDIFEQLAQVMHERTARDHEPHALPEPAELESALKQSGDLALPEAGQSLDEVADRLARVLSYTPSTTGSRFFNQLFGGRDQAALLGEMAAAGMNNSMYTYKAAGAQILIERALLAHMASFVGYSTVEGMFAPGGSLSNFAAMLVARNHALRTCRDAGFDGRRAVVYTSIESHYSVRKAAGMLGIGRDNVRLIDVDSLGHMVPEALQEAIAEDQQSGCVPVMINATAGTTVRGVFDPIATLATIAQAHDIWLHVDGAFGGSVLLDPTHRHLLAGCQQADSFTWDAHKMMGVPLTCSAVLFKHADILQANLDESASYLFQRDDDLYNPGVRSLQCGRRNDALKLWTAWQHHGDSGYAQRIAHLFDLADHAASIITAHPALKLAQEPESVNVCFTVDGVSSQALCDRLDRTGALKVGHGKVNDQVTVRLVCVNPDLSKEDIDHFFEEVLAAAHWLKTHS